MNTGTVAGDAASFPGNCGKDLGLIGIKRKLQRSSNRNLKAGPRLPKDQIQSFFF